MREGRKLERGQTFKRPSTHTIALPTLRRGGVFRCQGIPPRHPVKPKIKQMKTEKIHRCIAERTNHDLIANYLDYFNNYLTVSAFAQAYGLTPFEAMKVIGKGRDLNESAAIHKAEGNA